MPGLCRRGGEHFARPLKVVLRKEHEPAHRVVWGRFTAATWKDGIMDADRIKGSANQAKGKIKEVAGKAIGDSKLQSEGVADQVKGKVQNAVGGVKDAVKDD
jgi:uncharacterized protein YjbJ (UPF0337 family)